MHGQKHINSTSICDVSGTYYMFGSCSMSQRER